MNFNEASSAYAALRQQLSAGQINQQQFTAGVQQLRVAGPDGSWWQINEADGSWLHWDGQQWLSATPPLVQANPSDQAPEGMPRTLAELGQFIIRGILSLKGLSQMFILAPVVGLLVMILHTYFLVVVNEGFNADSGTNPLVLRTLAVEGKIMSSTIFWGLFSAVMSMTILHIIGRGLPRFIQDLSGTPEWIRASFQQAGNHVMPLMIASAGIGLVIGTVLNGHGAAGGQVYSNQMNSLLFAIMMFLALSSRTENLTTMVATAGWFDVQRWFLSQRPATQINVYWVAVGIAGFIGGLLGAVLLGSLFWVCVVLGIAAATAGIVMLLTNKTGGAPQNPMQGGHYMIFIGAGILVSLVMATTGVMADDGGWQEAGGTFSSWWRSEGAAQAIAMGMPPAIASAFGSLMGAYIANLKSLAQLPPGGQTGVPVQPQTPEVAPRIPFDGEARADGSVYAGKYGQGWVDRGTYDWLKANKEGDADFRAKERAKIEAHRHDVEQKMEAKRQAEARALEKRKDNVVKRSELQTKMNNLREAMKNAHGDQATADWQYNVIDWAKWGLDSSVNVLAGATGPFGRLFGAGYTMVTSTAEGASDGYVNETGMLKGGAKGVFKGAVNVVT